MQPSATILLFISHKTRQLAVQNTLNQTANRVFAASTYERCLVLLERHTPRLVIVDFVQQDPAACQHIVQVAREHQSMVLAIVQNTDSSISGALACGVHECVIDPVHPLLMLQRVRQLLLQNEVAPSDADDSDRVDTKHRRLLDSANDALFITDVTSGQILEVNRTACRWLGYTRDELLKLNYTDIEIEPNNPAVSERIVQELSTSGHFIFEQGYLTRSGDMVPAEVSSRIIRYEGKRAILSFARDISERKQIELAEHDQRILANALRDSAAALSSTLKLDEVMQRIMRYVTRVVPAEMANIILLENGFATIRSHLGYDQLGIDLDAQQFTWDVDEVASMRWMIEYRQPLVIPDVTEYPDWATDYPGLIRSFIGAPIIVENLVIGFIHLSHRTPNSFTSVHAAHLQAFANQASIAIQNAQLHEAIKRHAENLETRVAERTLELIQLNLNMKEQVVERQRIEEALQEERNLLRTLIDNIPDEIYIKDRDGRFVLANKAYLRRASRRAPNGEVIGSTYYDYVTDEASANCAEEEHSREQDLMALGSGTLESEVQMVASDLVDKRWFHTMRVPLHDSQNKVIGLVGVNHDITQRKQDEERLTHIISGAYCLLWYAIVDDTPGDEEPNWEIFISDEEAAQRFLPYDLEPGQSYRDAWHNSILPDDFEMMNFNSREAIHQGRQGYNQEFRCQRPDGSLRWLREEVQIKPLTPGRYSLVGVCTDITERKNAEETLQRTNELLEQRVKERTAELSQANEVLLEQIAERNRAEQAEREQRKLAEALSDAAAALNETLDLKEVMDRLLTFAARVVPPHEYASVMLIEDDIYVRIIRARRYLPEGIQYESPDERFYLNSFFNLQQMLTTGQPITIADTRTDPNWISLPGREYIRSYIGVPVYAEGAIIGFINLGSQEPEQFTLDHSHRLVAFSNQAGIAIQNARLFDAVARHASELQERVAERTVELEHERGQLHAILNAMADGVVFYDNDGRARYINRALAELTGCELDEWITAPDGWPNVVLSNDEIEQIQQVTREQVMRQGIWQGEIKMGRKDGDGFDAKMVMTVVAGTDGYPAGWVMVVRDVSAEKRLEEQKARFIATASHELRTPITNLKTRLYLIKRQPEKLEQHLDVMTLVTDRMRKLVDDLLDISRFEHNIISLELSEVHLQALVDAVVRVQSPEAALKSITINEQLPDTPLYVIADESRLWQVITNLITNAINYTPENGTIHVMADVTESHDGYASQYVSVAVQDTGIGIPPDLLPQVFKPFFRVNDYSSGMGLGLSITKEIVEMHRGEISVESEVNKGTCFIVKLPLVETLRVKPFVE